MAISDQPWNFVQSDFSQQQWREATLIDTEDGSPESRDRYKLAYREPNGEVSRQGAYVAAAQLNELDGVSADKKAVAARKLAAVYRNDLGETPPDSLLNMGGEESDGASKRSAPPLERLWSTTFLRGKDGSPVELRSKDSRTIGGYAAVCNRNSENLGGFRNISGDRSSGDRRGRGHEDLRARRAHAALEVARSRGDAHVVLTEHAHVSARTRAARRGRDDGARLHERLHVAGAHRVAKDRLRRWRDDETHARRYVFAGDDARGFGQIVERAVGARADERRRSARNCG